jgi:hypothetical protein
VLNRRRRSSNPATLYQKILANHLHTRHIIMRFPTQLYQDLKHFEEQKLRVVPLMR